MNILIVYCTHDGQTEKIAHFLAGQMRAHQRAVEVVNAARPAPEFSVSQYDAVIIGAPVRMGKYPRAVIDFVRTHRARLEKVPSAFFSVCMAAANPNEAKRRAAENWPERLFKDTGWRPRLAATFAGALRYTRYNWFIRWLMKRIAKFEGASTDTSQDHEYTDWESVSRFAKTVLTSWLK